VVTIDLSENDIETLAAFRCLPRCAPHVKHLSLSSNQISSLSDLDYLTGLRELVELILTGNPVTTGLDRCLYHHEVRERFVNLKLLDSLPLQPPIKFNLPSSVSSTVLPPVKASFFDSTQNQTTCTSFVTKYFALFDTDERQKLYSVYTPNSCFSLSLSMSLTRGSGTVRGSGPPGVSGTGIQIAPEFLNHNRNLHESAKSSDLPVSLTSLPASSSASSSALPISSPGFTNSLVKIGPLHITYALDHLPKTKHIIKEFTADVLLLPTSSKPLLSVSIRGSFLEVISNVVFSFHRVFLLMPPSQEAVSQQWPALILNDQLTLVQVYQLPSGSPPS